MSDAEDLVPEEPREAGVPQPEPDSAHIEGAELLADQAADTLGEQGFSREEILAWAEAYVAARGAGDVDDFLAWMREQERSGHPEG